MTARKSRSNEGQVRASATAVPRLVKAAEFEARRQAAREAAQAREQQVQARPAFGRAPRGEVEAREMFDLLFDAA